MATSFQQTDTAVVNAVAAYCSGLALTAGTITSSQASIGGTAGTATNSPAVGKGETNTIVVGFELTVPAGATWGAGTWTIRLNVSTANSSVTWTRVYICRVSSAGVNQATIGSNTAVNIALGTTGVKSATVTGTAQTPAAGDEVYILLVFSNSAAHANSSFSYVADQLIDSPFTATVTLTENLSDFFGTSTSGDNWTDTPFGLGIGFPNTEQMVLSDGTQVVMEMREVLSDTNVANWADSPIEQLLGFLLETPSDSLNNWADALRIGYGLTFSEQLVQNDAMLLGYGNIVTDQMSMSDLPFGFGFGFAESMSLTDLPFGFGLGFAEQIVLSDALIVGYGVAIAEQMTLVDVVGAGYGLVATENINNWADTPFGIGFGWAEQLVLTDAVVKTLGLNEIIAEQLSMADALIAGYGVATSDQLVMTDVLSGLGYGLFIADYSGSQYGAGSYGQNEFGLAWNDAFVANLSSNILQLNEALTDTMSMADQLSIGYGDLIGDSLTMADVLGSVMSFEIKEVDQLSMSDAVAAGYGAAVGDQLTLVDVIGTGYGIVTADQMVLTDAEANTLGLNELLSDQLVLTDVVAVGYGLALADTVTLTDAMALTFGLAINIAETLSMSDVSGLGYGFLITDNLNNWNDSVATFTNQPNLVQSFADQMVMSDGIGIGYGLVVAEQMILTDQAVLNIGLREILTDALSLSDAIASGYGMGIAETLSLQDQLRIGYGLLLSDSESANWQDAFFSGGSLLSEALADAMTMADSLAIGYGQGIVEQFDFVDTLGIEYGQAIADQLVFADVLGVGYGIETVDQLEQQDAVNTGTGSGTADSMNNWADGFQLLLEGPVVPILIDITDAMIMSDFASVINAGGIGPVKIYTVAVAMRVVADSIKVVERAQAYGTQINAQVQATDIEVKQ